MVALNATHTLSTSDAVLQSWNRIDFCSGGCNTFQRKKEEHLGYLRERLVPFEYSYPSEVTNVARYKDEFVSKVRIFGIPT